MYAVRLRQIKLSPKIVCGHALKTTQLSAHAAMHVSLERDGRPKYVTTIVLGDNDFPLRVSNFGDLAEFRAILAIVSTCMRTNGYS